MTKLSVSEKIALSALKWSPNGCWQAMSTTVTTINWRTARGLERRGYAEHSNVYNRVRWTITEAGRAALAEQDGQS